MQSNTETLCGYLSARYWGVKFETRNLISGRIRAGKSKTIQYGPLLLPFLIMFDYTRVATERYQELSAPFELIALVKHLLGCAPPAIVAEYANMAPK